jgi:hypothetical protein
MKGENSSCRYGVLNPWADIEPEPLRVISPRVENLDNKTIGLFDSGKGGSGVILDVVQEKLVERFPTSKIDRYVARRWYGEVIDSDEKEQFEKWTKSIDTAVAAVGD